MAGKKSSQRTDDLGGIEPIVKPVSRKRQLWQAGLLDGVRSLILREPHEDFVLKATVAATMQAPEHEVGRVLIALAKEGLLSPVCAIQPFDSDGKPVVIDHKDHLLQWDKKPGRWCTVVRVPSKKFSRRVSSIGRRTAPVAEKKYEPYDAWDGRGHYILRSSVEFREACVKAGLTDDPVNDPWRCRCGFENFGPRWRGYCKRCYGTRRKTEVVPEESAPKPACPGCGGEPHFKMVNGKRRVDVKKCREAIVDSVLGT